MYMNSSISTAKVNWRHSNGLGNSTEILFAKFCRFHDEKFMYDFLMLAENVGRLGDKFAPK